MTQRSTEERGAVMLLLLIVSMTTLVLIGLAIDSGNLYTDSMLLQKAIDAGALAAAKKIAVTGKAAQYADTTAFTDEVTRVAESMIDANLKIRKSLSEIRSNLIGAPLNYKINVDLTNDTVEIKDVTWSVPLIFLRFLPGYGAQQTINVYSKAQVQRSMVSLLLDSSGSMLCPADGSDCSCLPLCTGQIKYDRLQAAVALFAQQFNTHRDLLHIAYFSVGAFTAMEMHLQPTPHFDLNEVDTALQGMQIVGGTNQTDALLMGWNRTHTPETIAALGDRRNVAYVLFSDGAPTASRFFFAHPTQLPVNNAGVFNFPGSDYDYYDWSVNYRDPADSDYTQKPILPLIPGPMVLARAGMVPYNWDLGNPPQPPTQPNDSTVVCSKKTDPRNPDEKFNQCLFDFGFYDFSGSVWGAGVPWSDYRKQYYNTAIAMSDALRKDGGIVYTVGLGAPPPASVSGDPYQNPNDDEHRKDYFFSRIADDNAYKLMPHFPNEFDHYIEPQNSDHISHGSYLALDNALTINDTFLQLYDKIVRKVKTVQLIK